MNTSSLITCLFNCGQSVAENEMERHLKTKCVNKLKYIHCSLTEEVYKDNSSELKSHITTCEECRIKKVDIDILSRSSIVSMKNRSQKAKQVRHSMPSADDTILNIQLSKKKAKQKQSYDINNTMIQGENQQKNVNPHFLSDEESFFPNKSDSNPYHNFKKIIKECQDEEEDEEKYEEFNSYFINASIQPSKQLKDSIAKDAQTEKKESSSDYEEYFI